MENAVSLIISPEIRETYPGVVICLVQAEVPCESLNSTESHIYHPESFSEISLKSHTEIELNSIHQKFWHDIYKKFGVNPKRNKPSFEALTTRYIKHNFIPKINPVVDLYNRLSIKYQIPAGAFASSTISPEITLRNSVLGEKFCSIGSTLEEDIPVGTVIYSIPDTVITYGWNYRDADLTKVSENTRHITFVFEAAREFHDHILQAVEELNVQLSVHNISYYET